MLKSLLVSLTALARSSSSAAARAPYHHNNSSSLPQTSQHRHSGSLRKPDSDSCHCAVLIRKGELQESKLQASSQQGCRPRSLLPPRVRYHGQPETA